VWLLKAWMCLSHLSFLVSFEALSWRFSWSDFDAFLFRIWWGCMHEPFMVFSFDSPPKSVIKGARCWGFLGSNVRGVLGGISSIPLDLAIFWWTKSCLWSAYDVFLLSPKSCTNSWSNSGDQELDLEELTRGCCSPRAPQPDRSNW
jgi:hypothetical protein